MKPPTRQQLRILVGVLCEMIKEFSESMSKVDDRLRDKKQPKSKIKRIK